MGKASEVLKTRLQYYIAASKNTSATNLEKWRSAYAAMEKDGTRARVLAAYGLE
jgi:hypothetical protein